MGRQPGHRCRRDIGHPIQLLEPIYEAQFESIRAGRVTTMDETPIKAGHAKASGAGPGKMKSGYFWPVYGERDEVCFPFYESRRHEHVQQALGLSKPVDAVLVSDGYEAYASYAKKIGIINAQCWIHLRRGFFEAKDAEPQGAAEALSQIGPCTRSKRTSDSANSRARPNDCTGSRTASHWSRSSSPGSIASSSSRACCRAIR